MAPFSCLHKKCCARFLLAPDKRINNVCENVAWKRNDDHGRGVDLRLVGLKELHRLSLLDGADSRELYRQYLEVGCRLLGLSVGIISRVQGQDYQVLAVQSGNDAIRTGDHFALGDTYCAEVLEKQGSVALFDVGALESMRSHPSYTGLNLQAYIATPIRVQGDVVGTLNFSDTRPRPEPFSMEEMEFLELMALSLGHGLERSWLETQRVRAVEDMETNVALFEGAFRHAAIGMAIVAPNGRWLRVNEAVSQIVGYSDSELREIDFQAITHPDDLEKDLEYVDSLLRGEATTYRMKNVIPTRMAAKCGYCWRSRWCATVMALRAISSPSSKTSPPR